MVLYIKLVGSVLSGCVLFLGLGAINIPTVVVSGKGKTGKSYNDYSPDDKRASCPTDYTDSRTSYCRLLFT